MKKLSTAILFAAMAAAGAAHAATDGTLGATSTGNLFVNATVEAPPLGPDIIVTGLENINFGAVPDGTAPAPITISNICVSMTEVGTYQIQIDSSHSPVNGVGRMVQLGGEIFTVDYNWNYTDGLGNSMTSSVGTGFAPGFGGTCSAGELSSLTITAGSFFYDTDISASNAYDDILTLTVSPE